MSILYEASTDRGQIKVFRIAPNDATLELSRTKEPFICGVELASKWAPGWMAGVVGTLLANGAAYLSFHGLRAIEAHDIADIVRVSLGDETDDRFVFTTFHNDEALTDFIHHVLHAVPSDQNIVEQPDYLFLYVGTEGFEPLVQLIQEAL